MTLNAKIVLKISRNEGQYIATAGNSIQSSCRISSQRFGWWINDIVYVVEESRTNEISPVPLLLSCRLRTNHAVMSVYQRK